MTAKSNDPIDAVIEVAGYTQRYANAVRHVLEIEGGFVDDPKDRGGATKYGISLRFLASEGAFDADGDGRADFDLDMDGDIDGQDVRKLTPGDAIYLYHRCFWVAIDAESFPVPIGEAMFDQAVNAGRSAARKLLQQAINDLISRHRFRSIKLKVDGAIGPMTRAQLDTMVRHPAIGIFGVVEAYRDAVKDRYHAIVQNNPSQARFLKGWLKRADRLGRA